MSEFKFVCREEELDFAQKALSQKKFIIYNYFNDSGLTHYLKKLCLNLNTANEICFYIDCTKDKSIATQIATQIVSSSNKQNLSRYTKDESLVFKKIIESLAASIDVVPFVNVGEILLGFTTAVKDTLDTDLEHLSDYKLEKAIISMLKQTVNKKIINRVFFLIDDISSLKSDSLDFIVKIMDFDIVGILAAIPNNHAISGIENLSKIYSNTFDPFQIDRTFERPSDKMIKGLYRCYECKFEEKYLNIFERHERNIHIIMSYIHGFNMDFMQLDNKSLILLKIILILNTSINMEKLREIYTKCMHLNINSLEFRPFINSLETQGFLCVDKYECVHLNNNIVTEDEVSITLVERLTISRDIIDVFEKYRNDLTVSQLKFAIHNLEKDYSRRKSYILELLDKEKKSGKLEQQYLDMLFYLDNKSDLIKICSMYYNLQVYDVPFLRIQQHSEFINERECQDLLALLQERLHKDDYCQALWNQFNSSTNEDEQCLLMAVLFTALFNKGENEECLKILNDLNYKFYYKKFSESRYYHFLLRNISYYIENISEGVNNYNYCLSVFKNSDPVNYNRTLSNFIGYLMNKMNDRQAKSILNTKIGEIKSILEFNDQKYLYLNINYGIYLMLETDEDPTQYFESILLDSGTTETPYIYSQINQALYISKHNPAKALEHLNEIYYYVCNSKVVPTKIFYKINRLLVEYMNDINNEALLNEIKSSPLRGNIKDTNRLYSFYSYRFKNKIKYKKSDWKSCFLPGYIFYHGFDAELLTSSLAMPKSKMW